MSAINVILVHGAWADGSSWSRVIPLLSDKGMPVTAVQLPLTSFDADVAAVRRAIALAEGEVILVGHSYAGAVIGEAGNADKVKRLVYIDAFAPDTGESVASLFAGFSDAPLNSEIRPDAEGFLSLTSRGIGTLFAQDVDAASQAILHATQGPVNGAALGGTLTAAAWHSRPVFYLIGENDLAILPAEQEWMATRMNATIHRVASSHVPMLSHPQVVADFIALAAV